MRTADFTREEWVITSVGGLPTPPHLVALRIPPAWTGVEVETEPGTACVATGYDIAGRKQRLYSPEHMAAATSGKFERVRGLLGEWEDIRSQIEADLNDLTIRGKDREAALVAYLIYETGMRPGSTQDTLAQVQAYGATTIQLRHVKPCPRGVRLQFIGKKGVRQNVLVTNPYLVEYLLERKRSSTRYTRRVFVVSTSKLTEYISTLGSGVYTAKDFRTARGTKLALELLGSRKRIPKTQAARKRIVNDCLDRVARTLGNTRAVSRKSYVDPSILERFL